MVVNKLRPVEQADLFRLKFISGGTLSPDGKQVAYTVSQVKPDAKKPEEDKQYSAIWLADVESGEKRQLTSGTAVDSNPKWSPDGKHIAFLSNRTEKMQGYIIPVDGGEARQITTLKQGVGGGLAWSPDGKHLAFSAAPIEEARDQSKPYRLKRHVWHFNEIGVLDDAAQDLYVVSAEGGEARQVTKDDCMNVNPQWSPDGKALLYMASFKPDTHNAYFPCLKTVDLVDGTVRNILGEWGFATAASWLPDGERIVFDGQPYGPPIGTKSDMWIVSAKGGAPECRTTGLKYGVGGGLQADMPLLFYPTEAPLSEDGQTAYIGVQDGGTVQIYSVALSGPESFAPVVSGERACLLLGVNGDRMAYLVSDFNIPTDLYVSDLDGKNERCLVDPNEELLAQLDMPTVEHLVFPGVDGVQVEGWAIIPRSGLKPYPTVLIIHGGPHGAFGHIFHFDTQMLCGAGYAVVMVNHRASTGYGDEFSTAIKGDWGNLDYKDLMAGVDYAIAKGIADPDRLGVCGLSGGGNLTTWIVGQTDRFKAAAPENPVTNWVSFYGVSDIGPWFAVEELGGKPHEIPEIYAKCSPITYAHRCKTPTLLVQAEHDWRCPPEQSEQFFTALKANGCIVEMLRLPGGAHAASITGAPANRRAHNEALLDWMNQYVLNQKGGKS